MLRVDITTDKQTYSAGDTVTYQLTVSNAKTGRRLTTDSFVSLVATDETVFNKDNLRGPLPITARVYLSDEVANN